MEPPPITRSQPKNMVFLKTVSGKKERSFNAKWYSKFPWLRCELVKHPDVFWPYRFLEVKDWIVK